MKIRALTTIVLALVVSASAGPAQADPPKPPPKPALRQLRTLRSLQSVAYGDLHTGPVMRTVQKEIRATGRGAGAVQNRHELTERAAWVPLGVDPELRKITVGTVLRKMNQRSVSLKTAIKAEPEKAVWDVVFVGAGVHTAVVANALSKAKQPPGQEPPRMLTIEGGDTVAANFRGLGASIARNSANREDSPDRPLARGKGNKNPSSGPWSDPDFAGGEWPEVGLFADTATVNLYTSGSDFLMKSKVAKVEERANGQKWPARYKISMEDGSFVYANQVVAGTGLGAPRFPGLPAEAAAIIAEERKKLDFAQPGKPPGIVFYSEALALAQASPTGRDPYRAPVGEVTFGPRNPQYRFRAPGARLVGADGFDVALEDVRNFAFDAEQKAWQVTLGSGETRPAKKLYARADGFQVNIDEDETPETFGQRVAGVTVGRDKRPLGIAVEKDATDAALRPDLAAARAARFAALRSLGPSSARALILSNGNNAQVINVAPDQVKDFGYDGVRFNLELKNGRRYFASQLAAVINDRAVPVPAGDARFVAQVRPRVAVIGGGDSGRTFLEYLYGQAPEAAYTGAGRHDTAQRGEVADVIWAVGKSGPADCNTFLAKTRSRYLRLAGKLRGTPDSLPAAELVNGDLINIKRNGDKYELSYQFPNNQVRVELVDRVIMATGFENKVEDLFGLPLEPVVASVPGFQGTRPIAKRAKGQDIFLAGPAAGAGVVADDETYSTKENVASLYAFRDRDVVLANEILARGPRAVNTFDGSRVGVAPRVKLATRTAVDEVAPVKLAPVENARPLTAPTSMKGLLLKAEMADVLDGFRFPEMKSVRITVTAKGKDLFVAAEELDQAAVTAVAKAISENPTLTRELKDLSAAKKAIRFEVEVAPGKDTTPEDARGVIRPATMGVLL